MYRGLNSERHIKIPYERNIIMLFQDLFELYDRELGKVIIDRMIKNGYSHGIEVEDFAMIVPEEIRNGLLEPIYQYYELSALVMEVEKWSRERSKKKIEN